ncbi:MAG: M6 family metalloprotease domain-containing protein [Paludibacteraceae bacterium]|nr:M6 family metalloprotease domain-containing protein [Paludibacteraceae bacterium]
MSSKRITFSHRLLCMVCGLLTASAMLAVPAKRGWQTKTQADGTMVELQLVGDEFYHYWVNREGQRVRLNKSGMYEVVGEAPSPAKMRAKRIEGQMRRQRKAVGVTPNLAPRGVVILVNFADQAMQSSQARAVFDELCNSEHCTVNKSGTKEYPSAAQYFADQSNGAYRPVFDVFGPVTLSKGYAYYGENEGEDEDGDGYGDGDDKYATDAVIEACILANEQYPELNFANYDSDNDGKVDFVYVIYAGQGEASGGHPNTIWPHNWEISNVVTPWSCDEYGCWKDPDNGERMSCCYTETDVVIDGKTLDNYAMSAELDGTELDGIGTLCHEFGHVIGLPDLYDTDYGDNYKGSVTPNDWNIMDGGSYNGDGHCPPNYDPWQKYFFGWLTPTNLGSTGQLLQLKANSTEGYAAYQINESGTQQGPTESGVCYYIENRQPQGWDEPLTGHGLLIWKVNFNETAWKDNAPNNTETTGSPLHTVVSAYGTQIGYSYEYDSEGNRKSGTGKDNCPWNPFPGTKNVTSWSGVSGKPLLDIVEAGGEVTLTYIEEPTDPFEIEWWAKGVKTTATCTGKITLPASEPTSCDDGRKFVGWCKTADYADDTTAPTFVKNGDVAHEGDKFYAVFATEGEGGEPATVTEPFKSSSPYVTLTDWSTNAGSVYTSGGNYGASSPSIKLTATDEYVQSAVMPDVITNVSYWYKSQGASGSSIDFYVSTNGTNFSKLAAGCVTLSTTSGTKEVSIDASNSIKAIKIVYNRTAGNLALDDISITYGSGKTYSNYSTSCEPCAKAVTINKGTASNGSFTINKTGEHATCGATVVVTVSDIAPAEGYQFKQITQTGVSEGVTINQNAKTVTYAKNTNGTSTINVEFEVKPKYTVNFYDQGTLVKTQQVTKGEAATPPTHASVCEAYTFVGWWSTELSANNQSTRTWVTDFTIVAPVDYYAIYSRTDAGVGETSFDETKSGVYKIYAQVGETKYYAKGTDPKIVSTTDKEEATSYTFEKNSDGFAIKYGGVYLYYSGSGTDLDTRANAYTWTIASGVKGTWRIKSGTNKRAIVFRAGSTNKFGGYSTDNVTASGTEYYDVELVGTGEATTTYYSSDVDCSTTAVESTNSEEPVPIKALRHGQIVIIRGEAVYTVTGNRIQ